MESEGYDCSNPLINTQSILSKYSYNTTIRRMASVKATDVVKKLEGDKKVITYFSFFLMEDIKIICQQWLHIPQTN